MLPHELFGFTWLAADDCMIDSMMRLVTRPNVLQVKSYNIVSGSLRYPLAHPYDVS